MERSGVIIGDQRLTTINCRLEEAQRLRRRQREAEAEEAASQGRPYPIYEPVWFVKEQDGDSDSLFHVYKNQYWEAKSKQDWSKCPKIF